MANHRSAAWEGFGPIRSGGNWSMNTGGHWNHASAISAERNAQTDNSAVFSPSRLTVHQSACLGVESLLGLITRIFKRLSSLSRRRQGLSVPGVRRRHGLSVPGVRRRQRLSVPGCQYLSSVLKFKLASLGSYQMLHTDMRRLTTGIRTAKCVVRRFLRCANVI